MTFRNFIFKKAVRLLPMVSFATFLMQVNCCIYFVVYHGAGFGPVQHIREYVSLWKWMIATLGIESGWAVPEATYVTWYVSVLMLCYVVFYTVIYVAKYIKISPSYFYVFIVLIGIAIVEYGISLPFFNDRSARGYYAFFGGLLLAKYIKKLQSCHWVKVGSSLAVLGIIFSYSFYYTRCLVLDRQGFILTFICYPALIIIAESHKCQCRLKCEMIGILAKGSFGVYVLHMPMLMLLYNLIKVFELSINPLSWQCMLGFTFGVYMIGIASYYGIERNISNILCRKWEAVNGSSKGENV